MSYRQILFFAIPLLFSLSVYGQYMGVPYIQNYENGTYAGHAQAWCATQDIYGNMYFGTTTGITVYDGEIEWINEGFTTLYGYNILELKEEFGSNIITASTTKDIKSIFKQVVSNKKSMIYQSQITTKFGELIDIQTNLSPILNDEGEIISIVAIDSDIRKLKKAENELKFTPQGGNVKITAALNDKYIITQISDTGVGMNPEKVINLFSIDQDVSTLGTENESGTGLGLILCKEFVERKGDTISVESKLNNGAVFYIELRKA